jgi:hypothetical protein
MRSWSRSLLPFRPPADALCRARAGRRAPPSATTPVGSGRPARTTMNCEATFAPTLRVGPLSVGEGINRARLVQARAGGVLPAQSPLLAYWVNRISAGSAATVTGLAVLRDEFCHQLARDRYEADLGCRRPGVSRQVPIAGRASAHLRPRASRGLARAVRPSYRWLGGRRAVDHCRAQSTPAGSWSSGLPGVFFCSALAGRWPSGPLTTLS